jgi:hypothetical protein
MKTNIKWIAYLVLAAIIIYVLYLMYLKNKKSTVSITESNSKPIQVVTTESPLNPLETKSTCPQDCLVPYPKGSKYYGGYYCNCGHSSGTFN